MAHARQTKIKMVLGKPYVPAQRAVARLQNGDKNCEALTEAIENNYARSKIDVFGAKNEIHVLPFGLIVSTEVIPSPAIFSCCNYFILAKNINFPPF